MFASESDSESVAGSDASSVRSDADDIRFATSANPYQRVRRLRSSSPSRPSSLNQDVRPDNARPNDAQPDDAQPDDARPGDAQSDDAQPDDSRPDDSRPDDIRMKSERKRSERRRSEPKRSHRILREPSLLRLEDEHAPPLYYQELPPSQFWQPDQRSIYTGQYGGYTPYYATSPPPAPPPMPTENIELDRLRSELATHREKLLQLEDERKRSVLEVKLRHEYDEKLAQQLKAMREAQEKSELEQRRLREEAHQSARLELETEAEARKLEMEAKERLALSVIASGKS